MNFSFQNTFVLGANPKVHKVFDITDYLSQGVVAANVSGILQLTGPAGAYYSNPGFINDDFSAPDIAPPGATPGLEKTVSLPLNGDNEVEIGSYYVDYKIKVAGQVFTKPIVNLVLPGTVSIPGNFAADLLAAVGQSLDIINSTGNNGTYTITGAVYDPSTQRTIITLLQVLPSAVINGSIQYAVDKIYVATQVVLNYNVVVPCPKLEITYDCGCAKLQSRDVTEYGVWTVAQRTHTIIYPIGSGIPDVVSSQALISEATLWTNTYVGQLSVDITTTPVVGFTITDTITAQKDTFVKCDAGLCCIYSCLKSVFLKYLEYKSSGNQPEAIRFQNAVISLFGKWMLYSIANRCGDHNEMAIHLAAMKEILEKDCACSCNDCDNGPTTQVIPICGPSGGGGGPAHVYNVIPCQGNNLLTVVADTVNDTTTFTVCVNTTNLTAFIEGIIANTSIGDLDDVDVTTPVDGQVLVWNNITQTFQNTFLNIDQLGDVDTTTNPPQGGDILVWNQITQVWEPSINSGILYNNRTVVATEANLNWKILHQFDVPAGSLPNAGSEIRATTGILMYPPSDDFCGARIFVNGVGLNLYPVFPLGPDGEALRLKGKQGGSYTLHKITIIRLSNTLVKATIETGYMFGFFLSNTNAFNEFIADIPVLDLAANVLNIRIEGRNETAAVADKVRCTHLMVERVKKII